MYLRTAGGGFVNSDHVIRVGHRPKKEGEADEPQRWAVKLIDGNSAELDDYYSAPGRIEEALGVIPRDDRRREAKR